MRRTILLLILLFTALSASAGDRFSYVYKPGGSDHTISMGGSLETILRVVRKYDGEYLWAERNGRQYLIRDAAVLAEIKKTLAPLEEAERPLDALHRRMYPVEQRAERLEDQIEELEDEDQPVPDDLERQLRAANRELAEFEREEARLDRLQEEAERKAEAALLVVVDRAIRNGIAKRLR